MSTREGDGDGKEMGTRELDCSTRCQDEEGGGGEGKSFKDELELELELGRQLGGAASRVLEDVAGVGRCHRRCCDGLCDWDDDRRDQRGGPEDEGGGDEDDSEEPGHLACVCGHTWEHGLMGTGSGGGTATCGGT